MVLFLGQYIHFHVFTLEGRPPFNQSPWTGDEDQCSTMFYWVFPQIVYFFHGWICGIYCWRECQGTLHTFDLSKLNDFVPSTAFRKTQMVVWFLCLCASWTLSPKVAGPTSTWVMPTTPMTFWCIVSWCATQWAGGKVVQAGLVKRTWMALDIWEWYVGQRIWQFRLWAGLGEDLWSNWWFVLCS